MSSGASDWTWPAERAIILYRWSWFDPATKELIAGWSQSETTNADGTILFEAEAQAEPRRVLVDPEGDPFIDREVITELMQLPLDLCDADGRPLGWVRALLEA